MSAWGWLGRKLGRTDPKTVARLVAAALNLISGKRSPLLDAALARDPDRAFELAVKAAAKAARISIDAREVRLAIAAIALEATHQQFVKEQERHLEAMLKLEGKS